MGPASEGTPEHPVRSDGLCPLTPLNGAQLKAVTVEAGMLALRRDATKLTHEDFMEGIAAVQARKKTNLNYYA